MGQKKLMRFAAIKKFSNVLEYPEHMPGRWQALFEKNQPLTLELACGKGEYAVGLGQMQPQRNYLGVDVKGNRLYVGAKFALESGLRNVAFLRTQIDHIDKYFDPGEVSEIWITFPDPQLRMSRAKKRLTHPLFLRRYQKFLIPDSPIHLKTDSPLLFSFTKKVIELYGCTLVKEYDDVYQQAAEPALRLIKTHYEGLDIAKSGRVHYLQFTLPVAPINNNDELLMQWVRETEFNRGD